MARSEQVEMKMGKRKYPKTPYFVSAELDRNGEVKLVTDEGDIFHVQMQHSSDGWPIVSRQARWRDQFDYGVKESKPLPQLFGPPKLVS